jgi:hypothetical protein
MVALWSAGCDHTTAETDPQTLAYFEQAWEDFDELYPYFIHKFIDWDLVYALYVPTSRSS